MLYFLTSALGIVTLRLNAHKQSGSDRSSGAQLPRWELESPRVPWRRRTPCSPAAAGLALSPRSGARGRGDAGVCACSGDSQAGVQGGSHAPLQLQPSGSNKGSARAAPRPAWSHLGAEVPAWDPRVLPPAAGPEARVLPGGRTRAGSWRPLWGLLAALLGQGLPSIPHGLAKQPKRSTQQPAT